MFPVVDHPSEGSIRLIAPPVQFEHRAASIKSLPPRLGEHSREILIEAGLSDAVVDELMAHGALVDSSDPDAVQAAKFSPRPL
jgi:crotonobetainyl-CoA:carnitine CoA-transferase CaiB-like acyl-CoA transferase